MIYTDEAHKNVLKMQQAIQRVRELHKTYWDKEYRCWCGLAYPCPTIKALDGEQ